jgi:predicted ATPase
MRKNFIRFGAFIFGFAIITLVLYAVSANSLQDLRKNATVVAKVYAYTNDNCSQQDCRKTYSIYANGNFDEHKDLSQKQVKDLQELIKGSDLNSISFQQSNSCSTSQNVSYQFPEKYGDTLFSLCDIQNYQQIPVLNYMSVLLANS